MLDAIAKLFDPYDRKARLSPALLAIVPALVMVVAKFGDAVSLKSGVVSTLLACGALFWLARIARNAGYRLQEPLAEKWGGMPTVQLLRHRNTKIDAFTKERYHKVLSDAIGQEFPSIDDEKRDPVTSDALYQSGIRWLIEQTRDIKKYAHLFKENVAYGFHRNMLGLRPVGLAIAVGSFLVGLPLMGVAEINQTGVHYLGIAHLTFPRMFALLFPIAVGLLWFFAVTEGSVEKASYAYAERLLQACEGMVKPTKLPRAPRAAKAKGDKDVA